MWQFLYYVRSLLNVKIFLDQMETPGFVIKRNVSNSPKTFRLAFCWHLFTNLYTTAKSWSNISQNVLLKNIYIYTAYSDSIPLNKLAPQPVNGGKWDELVELHNRKSTIVIFTVKTTGDTDFWTTQGYKINPTSILLKT